MADPASYRPAPGEISTSPGVYRFRDADGRVVYVGKAKNLRARLSSYFQDPARLATKTRTMVFTAAAVEISVEALAAGDVGAVELLAAGDVDADEAAVEAGGPVIPPQPGSPPGPPALDDPEAMARLRATFVTSHDGWVDDHLAFAQDWGFQLADIRIPVGLWYGSADEQFTKYAEILAIEIPHAERKPYVGRHIPPVNAYRDLLDWLRLG